MTMLKRNKQPVAKQPATKKQTATDQQTPYQRAYDEWSNRIGQARSQLKNWRVAALLSMVMVIVLAIVLMMVVGSHKQYVYVAKIEPGKTVAQLQPVSDVYQPSQAQQEYFVGKFVRQIMSLPLDPVIARNNWFAAYRAVEGRAVQQLTTFARQSNPLAGVGAVTKTVNIQSAHAAGGNSYELTWQQTTYKPDGKIMSVNEYNGLFTVMQGPAPDNVAAMMENPLGLRIVYFNITKEE